MPRSLQRCVHESLHEAHPGGTCMKAVARSYLWWSGVDKDVEDQAKACLARQEQKSSRVVAPLHPSIWRTGPWKRVHVNFGGPFLNKIFLIVMVAHSKWPEVIPMSLTTAPKTTAALHSLFAKYGLPEQLNCLRQWAVIYIRRVYSLRKSEQDHLSTSIVHPTILPQMVSQNASFRRSREQ